MAICFSFARRSTRNLYVEARNPTRPSEHKKGSHSICFLDVPLLFRSQKCRRIGFLLRVYFRPQSGLLNSHCDLPIRKAPPLNFKANRKPQFPTKTFLRTLKSVQMDKLSSPSQFGTPKRSVLHSQHAQWSRESMSDSVTCCIEAKHYWSVD